MGWLPAVGDFLWKGLGIILLMGVVKAMITLPDGIGKRNPPMTPTDASRGIAVLAILIAWIITALFRGW